MSKTEILHYYGRSVYEIRLELAMRLFGAGYTATEKCLEMADRFIEVLQTESNDELKRKFP